MLNKALSIKQPWLWAITDLDKRIENRKWRPPDYSIGERIALHSSKTIEVEGHQAIKDISGQWPPRADQLQCGAILATARLIGWIDVNDGYVPSPCLGHMIDDKWFFGPIGWLFDDIVKVDPIYCRGSLGLWTISPEIFESLRLK